MTLLDTLLWYGDNILYYAGEMLPCMLLALAVFCALLPARRRRLAARGLVSGPWREGGLLLFVMFCAGLAALTVFPAGFWNLAHWTSSNFVAVFLFILICYSLSSFISDFP